MSSIEYLLFGILMLLALGAVIAFIQFVVRPLRIYWAIRKARKMVASRNVKGTWQHRNVLRTLATAHNDFEAAELWKRLRDIQEISENWA